MRPSATETTHVSVNGLVRLEISDQSNPVVRRFNPIYPDYREYVVGPGTPAGLQVRFGRFNPEIKDTVLLDDRFSVGEGYLYCKRDTYKHTSWAFDIKESRDGVIRLRVDARFLGIMPAYSAIVEPIFGAVAAAAGYPIIHASGIMAGDGVVLFAGRGGAGKTKLATRLSSVGFPFVSDDRTIVSEGQAIGIQRPLNLFNYNLTKTIRSRLSGRQLLSLASRNLAYRLTGGKAKFFLKVSPRQIHDRIVASARLKSMFILKSGPRIALRSISRTEMIRALVLNEHLQYAMAERYFLAAGYYGSPRLLANHWSVYETGLQNNLPENAEYGFLEIPTNLDAVPDQELETLLR